MFIKVKIFPNSKKQEILEKNKDSFKIKLKEKPMRGEANKTIINLLSSFLKIPKQNIKLIKGFKQRNKIFEINIKNNQ